MRHLVERSSLRGKVQIESAATSVEELGNPVHRGTKQILWEKGVPVYERYAVQMQKRDYQRYDWIFGMDAKNVKNILRITGGDPENKVRRLLDLTTDPRDIADPWYTGNFEITYWDIEEGCSALLDVLAKTDV